MTPEQREELITRPFFIRYMPPSYPHGGTIVNDNFLDPHSQDNYLIVGGKRMRLTRDGSLMGFQVVNGRPFVEEVK